MTTSPVLPYESFEVLPNCNNVPNSGIFSNTCLAYLEFGNCKLHNEGTPHYFGGCEMFGGEPVAAICPVSP